MSLAQDIQNLKSEKNAIILAHYYEDGNIQDIADFVGDSYQLAPAGQSSQTNVILVAGVVFMGESVKILNPNKKVLVPDLNAGCSLVKASPYEGYLKWRRVNPCGIAVTYINSSAEVKAISDVIVTSSNAQKILSSIPKERPILFGPDRHLGRYLSRQINRNMLLWEGDCEVHQLFSAKQLYALIKKNPDAVVIAHPECDESVLQYAHVIGSTSILLQEVKANPAKTFIVATETGILHQMQKARPDAILIQAPGEDGVCGCTQCPYMKLNSLEKIKLALSDFRPEIQLDSDLASRARVPLERMIQAANGEMVQYPNLFTL